MATAIHRTARLIHKIGVIDLGLMVCAYLLYSVVREMASGQEHDAMARAESIVAIERSAGFFWEARLQAWVLSSETLVKLFNGFYTYGHFPVIYAAGLWLFFFHRPRYVVVRNAFLISGALSLVVFHLFPLAPPRLLPAEYGFVDTLSLFSEVNYHSAGNFVNNYAAMPSLHIGWNLLLAIAIVTTVRNAAVRIAGALMPVLMSITVVVTGNHYFLDIVGGVAVAMVGLFLALQLDRHGERVWAAIFGSRERARASLA
jgi:membrane-associated phospholipid phosphatase